VVAVAAPLEVDQPHEIDFVQFVGGPSLWTRVLLTRQQRSQADVWCSQAMALEHTLDGARAGQRTNVEGLEFGQDGPGPDQAAARGRQRMGLESAADSEDSLFQLGRDAWSDMSCPSQVVQTIGATFEIAAPPLVKPGLGAPQGPADERDGAAGEAERNGTLACREFVVHGNLRSAAASGCPRRSL